MLVWNPSMLLLLYVLYQQAKNKEYKRKLVEGASLSLTHSTHHHHFNCDRSLRGHHEIQQQYTHKPLNHKHNDHKHF